MPASKYPARHWELGEDQQPTQRVLESRRRADFVVPIPAPKKRKGAAKQDALLFDERSTQEQLYDHTAVINAMRQEVDKWRALPSPNDWRVTLRATVSPCSMTSRRRCSRPLIG